MSESAIFPYPEHWELTTLGQLCIDGGGGIQTGPFGSQLHSADYVEVGIPSIMPKNISIEGVSTEDIARITEEDALRLSKYLVKEGDIVYSRRGDVEKCSLITKREHGWLCGTGCLKVSLGENSKVPSDYIHAYLSHPAIREWISRHAVGATMPNLNTSILSAVPVLIPSKNEIDTVIDIWRNTTDKIILNRQTNQTLEQIAQAIFKSWFVDFEPTRAKIIAKAQGADPATQELAAQAIICGAITLEQLQDYVEENVQESAQQREQESLSTRLQNAISKKLSQASANPLNATTAEQLIATAALFPNALVESELGGIPRGWEVDNFEGTVEIGSAKRIFSKEYVVEGIPFYRGKEVTELSRGNNIQPEIFITNKKYKELKEKSGVPKEHDILITSVGTIGNTYLVRKDDEFYFKDGNLTWVKAYKKGDFPYFFKCWFDSSIGKQAIDNIKIGSTQQAITITAINSLKLVFPSEDTHKVFHKAMKSNFDQSVENLKQTKALVELRDALLPKLLSGELDVSALADNSEAGV